LDNFKDIERLAKLDKLIQLDLYGCPISEKPTYREQLFKLFPNLQILDNKDKDGNEVDYEEEDEDDDADGDEEEYEPGIQKDEDEEDEPFRGGRPVADDDEEEEEDGDDDLSDEEDEDDEEIEARAVPKKK